MDYPAKSTVAGWLCEKDAKIYGFHDILKNGIYIAMPHKYIGTRDTISFKGDTMTIKDKPYLWTYIAKAKHSDNKLAYWEWKPDEKKKGIEKVGKQEQLVSEILAPEVQCKAA